MIKASVIKELKNLAKPLTIYIKKTVQCKDLLNIFDVFSIPSSQILNRQIQIFRISKIRILITLKKRYIFPGYFFQ